MTTTTRWRRVAIWQLAEAELIEHRAPVLLVTGRRSIDPCFTALVDRLNYTCLTRRIGNSVAQESDHRRVANETLSKINLAGAGALQPRRRSKAALGLRPVANQSSFEDLADPLDP